MPDLYKKKKKEEKYGNIAQIQEREKDLASNKAIALDVGRTAAAKRGLEMPQLIGGQVDTKGQLRADMLERERLIAAQKAAAMSQAKLQDTQLLTPVEEQVAQTGAMKETDDANLPPITQLTRNIKSFVGIEDVPSGRLSFQEAALGGISSSAKIYDAVYSAVLNKKPLSVSTYETSFTDASNVLARDIELVRAGLKSPVEAQRNYQQALISINKLEEVSHNRGMVNLRYWITDGFELETSIAQEKALLESQRIALLQATIQGLNPTPLQQQTGLIQ